MKTLLWPVALSTYFCDRRKRFTASSVARIVKTLPILLQSLEAALEDLVAPVRRAEGEDEVDGFANRLVSEEHPASWIQPTLSPSSTCLESKVRDQFAGMLALVEDTILRYFGDAGLSMEVRQT